MNVEISRLKERFRNAGISHAAVIDDAFDDDAPLRDASEVEEFYTEISNNPTWQQELEYKKIPWSDKNKFAEEGLNRIYKYFDSFSEPLNDWVKRVFIRTTENIKAPKTVSDYLQTDFGIESVLKSASKKCGDLPDNVKLVFLDFDLEGTQTNVDLEKRQSVAIAKTLLKRGQKAPFLVLFSNHDQASNLSERFREVTGYLKGTFFFIPKGEAVKLQVLADRLSQSCMESPHLGNFQEFFLAIKERLHEVVESVERDVMQLDVQDYSFLQKLALQDDGAPLGDYLLNLFGTALSHELRKGARVVAARKSLDTFFSGTTHLPFTDQPSLPIKRLYNAMLTDPGIEDTAPHPHVRIKSGDSKNETRKAPPLLMLGDIFARSPKHPAYIVVNPACDLQYSPNNPDRPAQLNRSVYLLEGSFQKLTSPMTTGSEKRLEMIEYSQNNFYRVHWHLDRSTTIPLKKFFDWQKVEKYRRITRLNALQALAVQSAWSARLSRVGLPVNLPFYESCDISYYLPDIATKSWKRINRRSLREAILARHPKTQDETVSFTLTQRGCQDLSEILVRELPKLQTQAKRKDSGTELLADTRCWELLTTTPQVMKRKDSSPSIFHAFISHSTSGKKSVLALWGTSPLPAHFENNKDLALAIVLKISQ